MTLTRHPVLAALALLLAAPVAGPVSADESPASPPTRITDRAAAARLLANKGVSLQWIDWNTRGSVAIRQEGGAWKLRAAQAEAGGPGRLFLDGTITEIGRDFFTFEGTIRIADTPDKGRVCEKNKTWHFAVTQNRPYYRLREFEWCDYLTDYIDIYF